MYTFYIPKQCEKTLLEVSLEPAVQPDDARLIKSMEAGEGQIKPLFGKTNKITIGIPYYENLLDKIKADGTEITHEVQKMSANYDFHFVTLNCSFLPDENCRFVWSRFGIHLSAVSRETGKLHEENPIAHDIMPDEVTNVIKIKREVSIGPKLKFNLGIMEGETKVGSSFNREYMIYEPQIFAFGLGRPTPAWNFKQTRERTIQGNKRDLNLIIRTPKNTKVVGRFIVAAEVEYYLDRWIPVPLSKKRDDNVINTMYDLSE